MRFGATERERKKFHIQKNKYYNRCNYIIKLAHRVELFLLAILLLYHYFLYHFYQTLNVYLFILDATFWIHEINLVQL